MIGKAAKKLKKKKKKLYNHNTLSTNPFYQNWQKQKSYKNLSFSIRNLLCMINKKVAAKKTT